MVVGLEQRNTASLVNQPVVIGKNGGISWLKSWALLDHSLWRGCRNELMIQWDMSLRCDDAKYSTKAIFSSSWKIWQTLKFLALGKFSNFLPVSSFSSQLSKVSNAGSIYTLKLRTSMLSWLRTTAATEWLAGYLFNTQSQLICIIIAQPHPYLPAKVIHAIPPLPTHAIPELVIF